MSFEIILEDLNQININNKETNSKNRQDEIYHFLKYSYKYKVNEHCNNKIENMKGNFNQVFPFAKQVNKNLKKVKVKEFALEWFRKELELKRENKFEWQINNLKLINSLSGIYNDEDSFKDYINKLIPGSFGLLCNFQLESPYFSKDDDEFYIIDNPIMKEKVWKIPMIKGSSWKGVLLKAARREMNDRIEKGNIKEILDAYFQITRIFGTGSNDFRKVEDELKRFINNKDKENDDNTIIKQLFHYALYDLGLNLKITKNGKTIAEQILEQIILQDTKSLKREYENLFTVRKGRAVFYPTYFDRLSLEVINPHNRNTKAGTQPIYYEVVPANSKGTLQIIYIPYDSIMLSMEELKNQVQSDLKFLKRLVKIALEEIGIGAKSKLGWGRATINKEKRSCFDNMEGICND